MKLFFKPTLAQNKSRLKASMRMFSSCCILNGGRDLYFILMLGESEPPPI